MSTNTSNYEIKPLRECVGEEGLLRSYPQMAAREQRIEGDQYLLALLTGACRVRKPHDQPAPTVGELPEDVVRGIVIEVETLYCGTWRLHGEDNEPLLDRLDAHFRPLADAWLAARRERDGALARYPKEAAALDREIAARETANDQAIWDLPPAA